MITISALMVLLLGYQVTMPQVDNAKFTFLVYEGKIVRMNTQNGEMQVCDQNFKCEKVKE